jgi:hypothetical protein
MDLVKKWGLVLAVGCFLGAQTFDDPVMKARQQRALAQGIDENDLPPVPRGVTDPPPLPPPETHLKDSPHYHATRSGKRRAGKGRPGRRAKGAASARPAPNAKPQGKVAKHASRRVKGRTAR